MLPMHAHVRRLVVVAVAVPVPVPHGANPKQTNQPTNQPTNPQPTNQSVGRSRCVVVQPTGREDEMADGSTKPDAAHADLVMNGA
jgi:hypothetical protein